MMQPQTIFLFSASSFSTKAKKYMETGKEQDGHRVDALHNEQDADDASDCFRAKA